MKTLQINADPTCSVALASECVRLGLLSPEAAAIAATEPADAWWTDVLTARGYDVAVSSWQVAL
jgi:hypothetical protein